MSFEQTIKLCHVISLKTCQVANNKPFLKYCICKVKCWKLNTQYSPRRRRKFPDQNGLKGCKWSSLNAPAWTTCKVVWTRHFRKFFELTYCWSERWLYVRWFVAFNEFIKWATWHKLATVTLLWKKWPWSSVLHRNRIPPFCPHCVLKWGQNANFFIIHFWDDIIKGHLMPTKCTSKVLCMTQLPTASYLNLWDHKL